MNSLIVTKDGISQGEIPQMKMSWSNNVAQEKRYMVNSTKDTYEMLKLLFDDQIEYREVCWEIMLNVAGEIIGVYELSRGGSDSTTNDPKMIFQAALTSHAAAIILAHNHPQGTPKPSEADKRITWQISELGQKLGIPLLDHIICTSTEYFSFGEKGILAGPKGQDDEDVRSIMKRIIGAHI
jgi:DNA repair protein RadC